MRPKWLRQRTQLKSIHADYLRVRHAMRRDLVQEHQVANAQRQDADNGPKDDVADDAGQINRADEPTNLSAFPVKRIGLADNETLHVVGEDEQR